MNSDWRNRYDAAVSAAGRAGDLALHYFDAAVPIEWKKDESPVTRADREAEALIRTTLLKSFPQDGFLGEEQGELPGDSGFRWIIDPIDGTRNFVRGIPIWATLIGLEYRGETIAGVAEIPAWGQTYRALRGEGAFRGERRVRVSDVADLGEAQLFYSSLSWLDQAGREAEFRELSRRTQRQRGFGDFYGHVLVAQGSGELMVEYGVHTWDVAAIRPIVEEAGGRFSDWDGNPDINRTDILVSNGRLHEIALNIMRGLAVPESSGSHRREGGRNKG